MRGWLFSLAASALLVQPALAATTTSAALAAAPTASAAQLAPAALDELLAPIALYPDALLGQILAASSHPQEVMDGGNWLLEHQDLKGAALQDEAIKAGFGPSMQALVQFPTIIDMMCSNFDWTKQLGSVFNTDQAAVLASVQRLRAQAQAVGNLKSTKEQTVATQQANGQQVIVIQPADPKIVYVPQYPPQTVYTTPVQTGPTSGDVAAAAFFGFFAGVVVHSIISDSYYPCPHWGYGGFYYGGRPWGGPTYIYAPHYNYGGYRPGYGPGYGYRPPPNYPNSWNRPGNNGGNYGQGNGNRVGNNTTININNSTNNNYFNRFENNANTRPGSKPPPLVSDQVRNRPEAYRPPSGGASRPQASGASASPARPQLPASGGNQAVGNPAGRPAGGSSAFGSQTYNKVAPDKGYPPVSPNRPSTRPANRPEPAGGTARPQPAQRPSTGFERDTAFGGASRPAERPAPAQPRPQQRPAPAERPQARPMPSNQQAAERGRASVGGGGTRPVTANPHGGKR